MLNQLLMGWSLVAVMAAFVWSADPPFRIEQSVVLTSGPDLHYSQSRAALIPGSPPRVLVTTQEIEKSGSHGYRDFYSVETTDNGRTWSSPVPIESLRRTRMPEGYDFVMGDVQEAILRILKNRCERR